MKKSEIIAPSEEVSVYSIRNVKKFCDDHPEIDEKVRDDIQARAKKLAHNGILIFGEQVAQIVPPEHIGLFVSEVGTDTDHMMIGLEDIAKGFAPDPDPPPEDIH